MVPSFLAKTHLTLTVKPGPKKSGDTTPCLMRDTVILFHHACQRKTDRPEGQIPGRCRVRQFFRQLSKLIDKAEKKHYKCARNSAGAATPPDELTAV
jgi:hypothetical protein